jgi:site-specific recombinase XerD
MDNLVEWLQDHGYARATIDNHLQGINELVRWLKRRQPILGRLNQQHLNGAYEHFRTGQPGVAGTIRAVSRYFRERKTIPEGPTKPPLQSECQLEVFSAYLREVRGLAERTIEGHQNRLRLFLHFLNFDQRPSAIRRLKAEQIEAFVRRSAKTNNRFSLQHVIASVRAFLRQQYAEGVLTKPLHQQIDSPRTYRLEQLPRALPWEQVVALLRSIDRSTADGLRDFTLLYLAARYGLRSCELVRLTLDQIDWRAGTLSVLQTKTRQVLQLPITDEAGDILIRYLQTARPPSSRRELFLRRRAPSGPLAHTAVHDILNCRIRQSGLKLPTLGGHVLRHSFAVHLLRRGVPMMAIGDALGHRDPQSTAVYLRLALDDLRTVGLSVPSGGKPGVLDPKHWDRRLPRARTSPRQYFAHAGFRSRLAAPLRSYLEHWRALGRRYSVEEGMLRCWDDFLRRRYPRESEVSAEMFQSWATTMPQLHPTVRRNRLRVVRNFLLFHAREHPKTYIPDVGTFPKPSPHCTPRLVSVTEMASVLATVDQLPASHQNSLRPQTIRLALVLLFCCGLRCGELLRLQLRHYDANEAVLHIEASKFRKSRLVPLTPSVTQEMRRYLELRRRRRLSVRPESPLIWSCNPVADQTVYSAQALTENWQLLCLTTGLLNEEGRPPRLHDLRHSFAVAALHRWYRQGADAQIKLPYLATYMGHLCPASTHYYLRLTPDLRRAAGRRFHQHAHEIFGGGQ